MKVNYYRLPVYVKAALSGMLALALTMGVGRFAFTPILPAMLEESLLTIEQAGVLAAIHYAAYWLGATLIGRYSQVLSKNILVYLVCIALATSLMALPYYPLWFVLRFIAGVLSAWCFVMISHGFGQYLLKSNKPYLQSLLIAGVGFGIFCVGLITWGLKGLALGSSSMWLLIGGVSVVFIVLIRKQLAIATPVADVVEQHSTGSSGYRALIVAYGLTGFAYIIPATYLPAMAKAEINNDWLFNLCWPVFGLAVSLSVLVLSHLQQRFTDRQIWLYSQLIMAFGLFLPAFQQNLFVYLLSAIAVGSTFLVITFSVLRLSSSLINTNSYKLWARFTAAFAAGQFLGPVVATVLFNVYQSFNVVLVFSGGLLLLSCIAIFKPVSHS